MKIRGQFKVNRFGVRKQILLDEGGVGITSALVARVDSVKPPSAEVFVSESRGREGRKVIWLVDRTPSTASNRKGRAAERRWKKSELMQTLERIRAGGGKFMRRRGRSFD